MARNAFALGLVLVILSAAPACADTVLASEAGARLDSDLTNGGGTDDTAVLQRILDAAGHGKSIHLIIDGPALVSGLNVYGNSTVECTAGGGLYLEGNSARAILRNAHRSRGAIVDEHIDIRGCFLNGNRANQPSADISRPDLPGVVMPSNKEKDGTFLSGLQFLGVNYLNIENVTLWNVRAFGALIANANYVDIRNVIVDHGGGADADAADYLQTDGLHFKGPLRYVSIDTVKLRVGDDSIAFNANDFETNDISLRNDFGPFVGQGPITDVSVSNVQLLDSIYGLRILSTNERIDRIAIRNIIGTVKKAYLLNIGHWLNPSSYGNVGRITVDSVNVDRPSVPSVSAQSMALAKKDRLWFGDQNGGDVPLININGHIEALLIHNVVTTVGDQRPLLRIGPDAAVGMLDVQLTAIDPSLSGKVLQLDEGGRIDRLKLALNWQGSVPDEGKNPIDSRGGTVENLQWVDTPPMFVNAELKQDSIVTVQFSQHVDSTDFRAGVAVRVNGRPVGVSEILHKPDQADTVNYCLDAATNAADTVTWAYDATKGDVRNRDGAYLHSVSAKKVVAVSSPKTKGRNAGLMGNGR